MNYCAIPLHGHQSRGQDMHSSDGLFAQLGLKALFLVWNPPRGSRRSEQIGRELGIDVEYVYATTKQGIFYAPFKYTYQGIATWVLLARRHPQLVFVQDPPIFGALFVYLYSLFTGTEFIIDAHTEALEAPQWQWTLSLYRFLSRHALTTIVTNEGLSQKLDSWNVDSFVLEDPPIEFALSEPMTLKKSTLNVVMVCYGDYDEPVAEMVQVAHNLPDMDFYITGNFANIFPDVIHSAPSNVHFTGYLREDFFPLLKAADVIVCLTTCNHTFLSGANEALWVGKPLITSDWPLLKNYFNRGTVHVDNTAQSIQQGLLTIRNNLSDFQAGIRALQKERRSEWREKAEALILLIQQNTS